MPANDFALAIIRPVSSVNIRVRWIEVQGTAGNFLVGPDHSPLTALLKHKGDLIYQTTDGITKTIDVFGGIFTVENNQAVALLDS